MDICKLPVEIQNKIWLYYAHHPVASMIKNTTKYKTNITYFETHCKYIYSNAYQDKLAVAINDKKQKGILLIASTRLYTIQKM